MNVAVRKVYLNLMDNNTAWEILLLWHSFTSEANTIGCVINFIPDYVQILQKYYKLDIKE